MSTTLYKLSSLVHLHLDCKWRVSSFLIHVATPCFAYLDLSNDKAKGMAGKGGKGKAKNDDGNGGRHVKGEASFGIGKGNGPKSAGTSPAGSGGAAAVEELSSSPASVEAGKLWDAWGSLPGHNVNWPTARRLTHRVC